MKTIPSTVVALLAASFACAGQPSSTAKEAATKAAETPQTMLIIWGGGANPEDAERAIAEFREGGFTSSEPLAKVFSTDVAELKPGLYVAVLGACPVREANDILRRVRSFHHGIYLRRIPKAGSIAALKCPTIEVPKTQLYFEPGGSDEPTLAGGVKGDGAV